MTEHPGPLVFDASKPDAPDVVRRAFFNILRTQPNWGGLNEMLADQWFRGYVQLASPRDKGEFIRVVTDTYWALVIEGVIAPGNGSGTLGPSACHLTTHGKRVLSEPDYQPHDPAEYLRQLGASVPSPDSTVLAYLRESLHCYERGLTVASAMMLGIAAERVFLLVCESLLAALKDPTEQADFRNVLERFPVKPKLDWLNKKLREVQDRKPRPPDLPEDVDIKVLGIYNLVRCQRNELGHPRESPPAVTRNDAYDYLHMFPNFYATAEKLREFLAKNAV